MDDTMTETVFAGCLGLAIGAVLAGLTWASLGQDVAQSYARGCMEEWRSAGGLTLEAEEHCEAVARVGEDE